MKKIYLLLTIMIALVLCTSCNDEWKDEQFKQLVSFKANLDSKGVTPVHVRYKENGKVAYQLPLIVSGSTVNDKGITVNIALDSDTLKVLNQEKFSSRTELYYKELPTDKYEVAPSADIAAGSFEGLFPINLSLKSLDLVDKWILPLTIQDDPANSYIVNDRKHYRKALLQIMPFNKYSGSYEATAYRVYFRMPNREDEVDPMVTNTMTSYVVNENTVFFYAGLVNEDRVDRKYYKIFMQFNEDLTVTMTTDNPDNKLQVNGTPKYVVAEEMDATRPYLKNVYVTISLDYYFTDYTSVPGYPTDYSVRGSLIMLRKINTQIPDEDQAIEW